MHIILMILKIVGLIAAVTVALFLILVTLILVMPVRYKIMAEFDNDIKVSLKIKWLAGFLYCRKDYPEDKNVGIRICGIPLRRKRRQSKSSKNDNTRTEPIASGEDNIISDEEKKIGEKVKSSHSKEKKLIKQKQKKKRLNSKFNKGKSVFFNISNIFKMIRDENNKRIFLFMKTIIFKLLKHAKPRNIKANLVIGLEDPAETGMLFGGLGIVRGFIKGKYNLYPCFEEKKLEGNVRVKGRIMLLVVLYYMIKIYNNQDIKRVLKKGREKSYGR